MSITPLSAARIAGELGLAGGTITGGTYAVKYSGQVNTIASTKDKEIQKEKDEKQKYLNTRGALRNAAEEMATKLDNLNTYWEAHKNSSYVQYKDEIEKTIAEVYKAREEYAKVSGNTSE